MIAEEMWEAAGLSGDYEAWAFGGDPDKLAELVKCGTKTATCSALLFYELENEEIPKAGDYSVILDANDQAVCIIKTTRVYITTFREVSEEHAYKEGEGDRSLAYWRKVHKEFFTEELASIDRKFDEEMQLVCEEFELVWGNLMKKV